MAAVTHRSTLEHVAPLTVLTRPYSATTALRERMAALLSASS